MLLLLHAFFGFFLFHLAIWANADQSESFYTLLGVPEDADLLTIRKAFKRLAIQKHPDKNPDDPTAHSTFVRINRAYEVLKDEELRRKYDQFGEKGLEEGGGAGGEQYQSWQFYRDNFGIYDEDHPSIITLSRADFHEEVFQSGETWFVNFYSAYCSHCHELAPAWRQLAQRVPEGVARIGAVNCAEDPGLCQSQRVMGYPSLVLYPRGEFFQGARDVSTMFEFLVSRLPAQVSRPSSGTLPAQRPMLVELCSDHEDCHDEQERKMIAAICAQIGMQFAVVECGTDKRICDKMGRQDGVFLLAEGTAINEAKELFFADLIDLRHQLLAELPPLDELDADELGWLLGRAPDSDGETTLAILVGDEAQLENVEWRRLPAMFPDLTVRAVPCYRHTAECARMHAGQLPRPALFRPASGFDLHYGNMQMGIREVAKFVRRSVASNLVVLDADKYWEARNSGDLWLIDHFAPWCPPCLRLLNELRKLPSRLEDGRALRIGTMDCEAHRHICQAEGVRNYPKTVLFHVENGNGDENSVDGIQKQHELVGFHTADQLLEFIADTLSPAVQHLDVYSFDRDVLNRPQGRIFFVDFFAPWCGPCQQLAPEFRRLARQWAQANPESVLSFGAVDCDQQRDLCARQGVHAYPALRLYRHEARMAPAEYPPNWWRNAQTMAHWLAEMMPSLVSKLAGDFANTVLDSQQPFLVDFYAPWCSHCVQFAPTFEQLAKLLEGKVRLGKVDCERFGWICQTAGVHAFPTLLLYFGAEQLGQRQSPQAGTHVQHGPDAEAIAQRVRDMLAKRSKQLRDEL